MDSILSGTALEYLRRIDGQMQELRRDVTDIKSRMSTLEGHYISLRKDLLHTQEDVARLTVAVDGMRGDIAAIRRCLDLTPA